ncbi:MAG TPA: TolC family protein [Candidatus Cloacimonas sp.]|nr:TolC family protein [Candidatus Cloacimonas sp.]HNQ39101.1 TolC family protein [Candidatus Cloacimonas sp.]HNS83927.1 TolC family protein [Candidatus Cloacimonas sp.]HPH93894.1 TolC family protein [Candidatus Cloacimonas sp.]
MKVITVIIMLLPLLLAAQSYTLEELITYGLENSFSVQKSYLSSQSSQSMLNTSKWNLLPDASVNGGIKKDFDPAVETDDVTSSAGFSLSKTISLNDAAYFNYLYASLDTKTANMQLEQTRKTYAYNVFSAYLKVLSSQKQRSSLEENLQIQTRVWEQSKILLQLGKTTPFEVKQNEIAVLNSNISLMQLDNTIANARKELFALVQMQDESYPLTELELNIRKEIPEFRTDKNIDINILNQELNRLNLQLKQNKLDDFPRFNLAYNLDRSVSGADFDFDRYNTNHGISLTLSYPLFNIFENSESRTRTKISRQLSQVTMEEKKDQLQRDYDSALRELQYLKRMNELYSEQLAQSREQITQAEERYRLGLIELLELDKTRTNFIETDISYNNNLYSIIAKQEEINYLLSEPLLGKW